LQSLVLGIERWMLRRFDVVSSISGRMLDRLRQKNVMEGRMYFFLTGWILPYLSIGEPVIIAKNLGSNGHQVAVLGTLGSKQGLMVIPDAPAGCHTARM